MAFSNDRWQLLAANNVMRMFAYDAGSDDVTAANYFASKWNDIRPDDMIVVSTDGALTNYRVSAIGTHSVAVEAIGGGDGGDGAPTGAQYVTLATHAGLSAERVLVVGAGLSLTDGGAGSNVEVALDADVDDVDGLTDALSGKAATSRSVSTQHSLTGGGNLTADRTLSLVGDEASPGEGKYYGTDGEGNKGYHALPGGSGDDDDLVTASNPSSPYTATSLTGRSVVKIAGLDHDLTINKPTGTFGTGKRFYVQIEVTASGGSRTITWGSGITRVLGVDPSLVVASGTTERFVLYTDDNGANFAYDGDAAPASDTRVGPVELATAAETGGGTDATRAVTPDGLAGSVYGIRYVSLLPTGGVADDIETGDGQAWFDIPAGFNGWNLVSVLSSVGTAGTTGTTDFQLRRVRSGTPVDMLSTKSTIDSAELTSLTAATPAVINTSNDDVATGDRIYLDVDAVSSTPPRSGCVTLGFQAP